MKALYIILLFVSVSSFAQTKPPGQEHASHKVFKLSIDNYNDKVHAIWASQIISYLISIKFENNEKAVKWVDKFPRPVEFAPVDDDWYYEMITIKAFEKYGPKMTVSQLGDQWLQDSCGVYGSSALAKKAMLKGIAAPLSGHPFNNRFYFTIGPMFSSDVYGALAPGMPNLAAKLARYYAHVNGYAEGVDGAVFIAGLVSAAFIEKDVRKLVRQAAQLIDSKSPFRQCIDMVIEADKNGLSSEAIFEMIETTWRPVYPMSNNAVANGGIIAACLLKGEGDFLKTLNLACIAGDNTDADCNAASAGAVIAAMHGLKSIPADLVDGLHNRIKGSKMGKSDLPPVDENITLLAARTVKVGTGILQDNGVVFKDNVLIVPLHKTVTQPAELFTVNDMVQHWNPGWQIEHATKATYISDGSLITYPAIVSRGLYLYRAIKVENQNSILLSVGAEPGQCWRLRAFIDNACVYEKMIESSDTKWQDVKIDISKYKGTEVIIRLYQHVNFSDKWTGNAHWKKIAIE